jgi:hypothetical protein
VLGERLKLSDILGDTLPPLSVKVTVDDGSSDSVLECVRLALISLVRDDDSDAFSVNV